jgi:hypothetical protein
VFALPGADAALAQALDRFGASECLQPASKVRGAVRAVQLHYESLLASRERALDAAERERRALRDCFDRFLVDISLAGTGLPVRLSDLAGGAGEALVREIAALRTCAADARREADARGAALELFARSFRGFCDDAANPANQIAQARAALARVADRAAARGRRLRRLRAEADTLRRDARARDAAHERELASLEERLLNAKARAADDDAARSLRADADAAAAAARVASGVIR